MMRSEVIILTEAGTGFGYGHLMRCLAIAQGFKENNISSKFFIRGDADPGEILNEFTWNNVDWLSSPIDVSGKITVLDSYHADHNFCNKVFKDSSSVLFIDDYNRIHYPGGYVLNSVLGAEKIGYPDNDKVKYLLGPQFHPFRRDFWNIPEKIINDSVEKVLITFGGTDITNETPGILKLLKQYYPDIKKHVIVGKGYSNIDEIKSVTDKNTTLIYHPDAQQMKQEMLDCDIAISAAGQTVYELAVIGTPAINLCIIKNQEYNYFIWKSTDTFMFLNLINGQDSIISIRMMIESLLNRNTRERINKNVKNLMDTQSTLRICKMLL